MAFWDVLQLENTGGDDARTFIAAYQEEADALYLELLAAYCDMNERMLQHFDILLQQQDGEMLSLITADDQSEAEDLLTSTL